MPDRCGARTHPNHRGRVRTSSAETTAKLALWGFLVTNLVTRRQIVPINGVRREPDFLENSSDSLLGYLDSNQEQLNQNQPCCQLHHTPTAPTGVGPRGPAERASQLLYPTREGGRDRGGWGSRYAASRLLDRLGKWRGYSTDWESGAATRPTGKVARLLDQLGRGGARGRRGSGRCGPASRPCPGSPSTRRAAGSPDDPTRPRATGRRPCGASGPGPPPRRASAVRPAAPPRSRRARTARAARARRPRRRARGGPRRRSWASHPPRTRAPRQG